ncbi:hypothetical protein [uncultured Tessaracoccus sp.]|nr:hypothetical protein [uncultured Tessaracoccus sp.]
MATVLPWVIIVAAALSAVAALAVLIRLIIALVAGTRTDHEH